VAGVPGAVKLPANIILACKARQPLHSDAREPLWVQAQPGALQGRSASRSPWTPGAVLEGQREALLPARAAGLQRIQERKKERVGSVTFFTHKSTVRFESIEVEGAVRTEWLQRGFATRPSRRCEPWIRGRAEQLNDRGSAGRAETTPAGRTCGHTRAPQEIARGGEPTCWRTPKGVWIFSPSTIGSTARSARVSLPKTRSDLECLAS